MKQIISRVMMLGLTGLVGLTSTLPTFGAAAHKPEEGDFFDEYVTELYTIDNNLFRLPSGPQYITLAGAGSARDDRINAVSAGVEGQWTLGRQAIALDAHASDNRFAKNTGLNNVSGLASLMWDWRGGALWTGQLGTTYTRGLASFQNVNFFGRDIVDSIESFANGAFQLSPHWNFFGGLAQTIVTQSVQSQKINDFRNNSGNVGMAYTTAVNTNFGVNYEYSKGTYPNEPIVNFQNVPFDRDYKTSIARFLVALPLGGKTSLQANVGYEKRDYATTAIGSFSGDIWRAVLTWQPLPKTRLILNAWRQITAYLDAESTYFISTGISAAPTWTPTERIELSLAFSSEKQDYLGPAAGVADFIARRDRVAREQATLVYTPRTRLSFTVSSSLQQRSSNTARYEFNNDLFSASVTGKF